MKSILKEIPVEAIQLDDENPRLRFSKIERGIKNWTQENMMEEIQDSPVFNRLFDSIHEYGVIDPIWVYDLANGSYQVIEGNMRVTVLRELIKKKIPSSGGINYKSVRAHVVPNSTSQVDLEVQKAILQTGKTPWGAFNEAAHIYNLFWKNKISIEDIASMLGKSRSYIDNEIDNFKFYLEFIEYGKKKGDYEVDPKKYSFFKDAPGTIKQKFFKSPVSRKNYFELITPNKNGITRIPSVSLKGGLRTFGKIVEDDAILKKFLNDARMTVDDAFLEFTEKNYLSKLPWIKKIPSVSKSMNKLNKFERKKIFENPESKKTLTDLYKELKKFFK
ncbi:hypothetical protein NZNM25_07650 [Nitrosopumilus zosterae]|uniref:ParB-like N-terminal domain-containing protein n=1 Tax=Nitrosopumilus zosterae TaxID=718286 RepID=A0A2S2KQT1_9ARCH|nr:ParB N-terminal domain-containing protein [Nitrosopumilus zosterae]BDQ30593.1 ParB N-terminal domain-containing protein [Nitrosopumilus zosterae]GBH33974.1 hypothetical protein NZNM25_07650 [Nitrosopumilus zosterae]